jgi:hypothetical protein
MTFDHAFSLANTTALVCWAALVLLPRGRWMAATLRYGIVAGFCAVYAALLVVYFTSAHGGGFNSIAQVRALFGPDANVLAGWIHYLAWDLFVGLWIAERADALGVSRWVQGPVLFATFMFGPVGYLLFVGMEAALRGRPQDDGSARIGREALS